MKFFQKILIQILSGFCGLFFIVTPGFAFSVTLAWDANTEDNLAGYKVYYSTEGSGEPYEGIGITQGDSPIDIPLDKIDFSPDNPEITFTDLDGDKIYWIVVTAYNTTGLESDYSNEVQGFLCHAHDEDSNNNQFSGCFIRSIRR